ncbi:MAG: hypothetical protein AAF518_13515 [Spirochaetota bacterium]
MIKNSKRWWKLSFVLVSCFAFQGCFEIIHYLEKDQNNRLKVSWYFALSSALSKGGMGGGKGNDLTSRLKNSQQELEKKYKGLVTDMQVKQTSDEFETGIEIEFAVKDMTKIPADTALNEGFPLVPIWDKKKNQLIFTFLPDKKKKGSFQTYHNPKKLLWQAQFTDELAEEEDEPKVEPKMQEEDDVVEPQPPAPDADLNKSMDKMSKGMEGMMAQIMSSATYKVMLGKGFRIEKVHLEGIASEKVYDMTYKKYADVKIIRIPYMSLLLKEKQGFRLLVKLK